MRDLLGGTRQAQGNLADERQQGVIAIKHLVVSHRRILLMTTAMAVWRDQHRAITNGLVRHPRSVAVVLADGQRVAHGCCPGSLQKEPAWRHKGFELTSQNKAAAPTLVCGPVRYLLYGPPVAIRVIEEHEANVVEWVGGRVRVLTKLLHVADLNAAFGEFSMSSHDIGDNELQTLHCPSRHVGHRTSTNHNRATRAGWRELDDPGRGVDDGVMVDAETELLCVERFGTVDIRHRDDDNLKGPIHFVLSHVL